MSGQKPKQQQQANLFSFFKKSDAVSQQMAAESVNPVAAASKISSLLPSAEKTPSLSSDTMAKKVQSPEISQASVIDLSLSLKILCRNSFRLFPFKF